MKPVDRFEVLRFDRTHYEYFRDHREGDPFAALASGDPMRARVALLEIELRNTSWSPFMVQEGLTLLHIAARFGLREAAATLVEWGASADALAWPHGEVGPLWSQVCAALPVDGIYAARSLSPLHLAIAADHEDMVRFLLAGGANPRRLVGLYAGVEGYFPMTPLSLAETIAAAGRAPSGVAGLLRAAEPRSKEPPENAWVDSGIPASLRREVMEGARLARQT